MEPDINTSTKEERLAYINKTFWCRSDCDSCGICQVFRGKEPLLVLRIILRESGPSGRFPRNTGAEIM